MHKTCKGPRANRRRCRQEEEEEEGERGEKGAPESESKLIFGVIGQDINHEGARGERSEVVFEPLLPAPAPQRHLAAPRRGV